MFSKWYKKEWYKPLLWLVVRGRQRNTFRQRFFLSVYREFEQPVSFETKKYKRKLNSFQSLRKKNTDFCEFWRKTISWFQIKKLHGTVVYNHFVLWNSRANGKRVNGLWLPEHLGALLVISQYFFLLWIVIYYQNLFCISLIFMLVISTKIYFRIILPLDECICDRL